MSGLDPVAAAAARSPDAVALEDGEGAVTYAELERSVEETARRLATVAEGRGSRIALLLPPGRAVVELIHAGPRAGLVTAPLSPRLTTSELSEALSVLSPAAVLSSPGLRDLVPTADDRWRVVEVGGKEPRGDASSDFASLDPASALLEPLDPDETAYVLWTSGTTGRPRGVCITLGALGASARGSRERLDLSSSDRWLSTLSPAHVGGLALLTRAALLGSRVVLRPRFDEVEMARLAQDGRVTHASLVPVMLRRLLDHLDEAPAPEALECLLIGGARAPAELVRRGLARGYPLALTYGMTETTSQAATAPPERVKEKPGGVGRPLPGVEIRIGPEGEILVRGDTLAWGYLGPEGYRPLALDEGGWLRTGDLGRLDDAGELQVTGRRIDRIVSGGVTVDAHEVEDVLASLPGVVEAAVVGVPDPEWGETVSALVVPDGPADSAALMEAIRARLSGPKRPRLLRFASGLPRNRNGKVDRTAVRRILAGESGSGGESSGRPT